jgi:uncharacterized protein YlzI (FlbEa/FlbD family)
MPFDLNIFSTQLATGGARPNLFEVTLSFPTGIGVTNSPNAPLTLLCKASQIPGQDLAPIEIGYFGRKIKVAGDRTFPEWTITMYNDEDFIVRNAFEQWNNALNQHVLNMRIPATTLDYKANATVTQFAKTGDTVKAYNFKGVWPSNVQPIDLAWDNNDSIEEFQVTLQYDWWESPALGNSPATTT